MTYPSGNDPLSKTSSYPPAYGQPAPYGGAPAYNPYAGPGGYDPYAPPVGYPPYGRAPGTNGMAIASLVLGILWIYWVGSVLALVFGYVARSQMRTSGQSGNGMAIAGIVLGWVGIGFLALFFVIGVAAGAGT